MTINFGALMAYLDDYCGVVIDQDVETGTWFWKSETAYTSGFTTSEKATDNAARSLGLSLSQFEDEQSTTEPIQSLFDVIDQLAPKAQRAMEGCREDLYIDSAAAEQYLAQILEEAESKFTGCDDF